MSRFIPISSLQTVQAINLSSDPGYDHTDHVIPNCTEVRLVFSLADAKPAHIITHARYTGVFPGTTAMADAIHAGLGTGASWTALAGFLNAQGSFDRVDLRDKNVENAAYITGTTTATPGTGTGTQFPDEVSAVITLRTAKVGRSFRGRMFVPNWNSTAMGPSNTIIGAAVTALQNWANTIKGVYSGQGLTLVIGQPHRLAYTSPHTGAQIPERLAGTVDVTTLSVRDNHWDSQRRRGLK